MGDVAKTIVKLVAHCVTCSSLHAYDLNFPQILPLEKEKKHTAQVVCVGRTGEGRPRSVTVK